MSETKSIRDATKTIVSNFPAKLREMEIIQCAETGVTFIRKDLFAGAVAEYIREHEKAPTDALAR